jgi:hypothetical protein
MSFKVGNIEYGVSSVFSPVSSTILCVVVEFTRIENGIGKVLAKKIYQLTGEPIERIGDDNA